MLLYIKSTQDLITISEGTGDNLFEEDIEAGYVDYAMIECSNYDGVITPETDGGQLMLTKPYSEYSKEEIIRNSLDLLWGNPDLEYTLLED